MSDEDVIESAPEPPSIVRARALLHQPAAAALLLVIGLIAGSIGGFVVGKGNPTTLAGLGYVYLGSDSTEPDPLAQSPFEQTYGRSPLSSLTPADMLALGEKVQQEIGILSAQSAIPVMCGTSIGQPGTSPLGLSYAAVIYEVSGGELKELIWAQPDSTSASGTLQTLVYQAQICPDVPVWQSRVSTSGVLTGIGDEYAVFTRTPAVSGTESVYTTVVLVRLGADLIEVSFVSEIFPQPDAEERCLRAAAAAVARAGEG